MSIHILIPLAVALWAIYEIRRAMLWEWRFRPMHAWEVLADHPAPDGENPDHV